MMDRRAVLVTLGSSLLVVRRAAAQTPAKLPRVAVLSFGFAGAPISAQGQAAFETGLRELGWTPGSTIAVEFRWADNNHQQLARHVAELVRSVPDVVVVRTGVAQQALTKATTTIPIVLGGATDPVAQGFVQSLARPGGNVTGLGLQLVELLPKRIELLKEAVPKLQRLALLTGRTISVPLTPDVDRAARALGLEVQRVTVSTAEELPQAFSTISRRQSGAVVVHADGGGPLDREVTRVVTLAATHRLPAMYAWRQHVDAGGLMAFAVDIADIQRQTARFVDKILKGTRPADIPVEQPTKFELVINLGTARSLALSIPQSLLQRADHLIQ
jgi:putative ABC transport system substrate-binding protein